MDIVTKNSHVHIAQHEKVAKKIQQIIRGGKKKLLFISDFDYTLTKFNDSLDDRCVDTREIIKNLVLTKRHGYADQYNEMVKKYHAIERSQFKSVNEKIPFMEEWWTQTQNFFTKSQISKEEIKYRILTSKLYLRDHASDLLNKISANEIPYICLSKGFGDIVQFVLENQATGVPNKFHIVSNMMIFDQNNICIDFTRPIIHTFNKNTKVLHGNFELKNEIEDRTNVILMGDSLFDPHMDMGLKDERVALKIGFLNTDGDSKLHKYLDVYDIVIVEDQTMDIPLKLFEYVLSQM